MIFIDASALVAIAAREPEAEPLIEILEAGEPCFTSPVALFEANLALTRILGIDPQYADDRLRDLLAVIGIEVAPMTIHHAQAALGAHIRFGKGRHPARLNLGDCFAYAAARLADASILFVGNDFDQTDLPSALHRNENRNVP